jgi:hypothetical protein
MKSIVLRVQPELMIGRVFSRLTVLVEGFRRILAVIFVVVGCTFGIS